MAMLSRGVSQASQKLHLKKNMNEDVLKEIHVPTFLEKNLCVIGINSNALKKKTFSRTFPEQ